MFYSKSGQRPDESSVYYNNGRLPQNSFASDSGTAAASTWPGTSFSIVCDLSTDEWPNHYNQPSQQSIPSGEGAPLLTLQSPDADFPILAQDIYSQHLPWDVPQNHFQNLEDEKSESSMADPDIYPSPTSDASAGRLNRKAIPPDPGPVIASVNDPDQPSPSVVGSTVRPKLSLKRDHEPPRNEGGQITCVHPDCSREKPPTFQRKCEWRSAITLVALCSLISI